MSVHPIPFPSIATITLTADAWSKKSSASPSIHTLQDIHHFTSFVPSIQASNFPTRVSTKYSNSRPRDGPSSLPILHTSLNPSVSLFQTLYEPTSVHLSIIPSRHASTPPVHIQVLDYQYSEKPSQLTSYVFINVPSILPSQQPTLSPSGIPSNMPMILTNATPI